MKLYRNLGPISFESETESLQIFKAHPSTTIFQFKPQELPSSLMEQISQFYNNYTHTNTFTIYSEPGKGSAMLLSHSKKAQICSIDTNKLCNLILQTSKVIKKLSETLPQWVGDCSIHQLRVVSQKLLFVYIPLTKEEDSEKRLEVRLKQFKKMIKQMSNEKDISQKLLLRKLFKCKSLEELIDEVSYFSSVYCVGKNSVKEVQILPFAKNQTKRSTTKPNKKLSLFRLDLKQSKKLQYSSLHINNNSLSLTHQRQSSSTMHISLFPLKKHQSLAHSSQPRMSASTQSQSILRQSCSKVSRVSVKRLGAQAKLEKQKSIKRESKLKQSVYAPINSMDQEKLKEKLRMKKKAREQCKYQQFAGIEALNVNEPPEQEEKNPDLQTTKEAIKEPEIMAHSIIKTEIKQYSLKKSEKKEQYKTIIKQKSKTPEKKEIVQKLPLLESHTLLKQEVKAFQPDKSSNLQKSPISMQLKQPVKNKKQLISENIDDEIQVIELGSKTKNVKEKQKQKSKEEKPKRISEQFATTVTNSWNKEQYMCSSQQQTKRTSRAQAEQKLIQKCKQIDLMGAAVANAKTYLGKRQKMVWQLPLFFIYRSFYYKRQQLGKQAEQISSNLPQLKEILQYNPKIKDSINKLIKQIIKKVKKVNPHLVDSVKPFLTIEEHVNCSSVMNDFIKDYLNSLTIEVNKDPTLSMHLLEIIDAYLIHCGEQVDQIKRKEAVDKNNIIQYVIERLQVLKKYL